MVTLFPTNYYFFSVLTFKLVDSFHSRVMNVFYFFCMAGAKQTVTVLSGIMNFLHFRKQRMEVTAAHQQSFVSHRCQRFSPLCRTCLSVRILLGLILFHDKQNDLTGMSVHSVTA